jgi:1-acyl-sn-glycerol-3-phosphate acyltransferase
VRENRFYSQLTPTEKVGCFLGSALAETHAGRAAAIRYQTHIVVPTLGLTVNNRLHVTGLEHLPRDRSHIIAANHRSYFDLYAVFLATWHEYPQPPYLYCPVRTTFFYEKPLGVLFNVTICANAMYPPVFRDGRARALNQYAVDRAVHLLDWSPRTVVAMHPEGRRSTGDDPYDFLPPKAGVGRIALRSRAPVIPTFVCGLPPRFGGLVRDRVRPDGQPVRVHFGPAVDLEDLYDAADDREAHQAAADRTMEAIGACGVVDRAWMAAR